MKEQRLIIFCSEIDTDLEQLRASLSEQLAELDAPELQVNEVGGPEGLMDAGWVALAVTGPLGSTSDLAVVADRLDELVRSCATLLNDDVLGVYVNLADRHARASLRSAGRMPRSTQGESLRVLREVAGWLDADAVQLLRYFSLGTDAPERGRLPVDLSGVSVPADKELDNEPDEDDRFVDAKLKLAHELMQQYLLRKDR